LNAYGLFRIPEFRQRWTRMRYFFFRIRKLKSSSDTLSTGWLDYSKNAFNEWTPLPPRINLLVNYVSNQIKTKNETILVIGPRFECEIYGYLSCGLKKRQIQAIDTFSYSPLIKTGNMHKLQDYNLNLVDLVVCGWTLAYSENPHEAVTSMTSILKEGGRAILTWDLESFVNPLNPADAVLSTVYGKKFTVKELFSKYRILEIEVSIPIYNPAKQFLKVMIEKP
jgi:hypothetical protein